MSLPFPFTCRLPKFLHLQSQPHHISMTLSLSSVSLSLIPTGKKKWFSSMAQRIKILPAVQEMRVLSLGQEDPLGEDLMDRGAWLAIVHEAAESDTAEL